MDGKARVFDREGCNVGDVGVVFGEGGAKEMRDVGLDQFILDGLEGFRDVWDDSLNEAPFMLKRFGEPTVGGLWVLGRYR